MQFIPERRMKTFTKTLLRCVFLITSWLIISNKNTNRVEEKTKT